LLSPIEHPHTLKRWATFQITEREEDFHETRHHCRRISKWSCRDFYKRDISSGQPTVQRKVLLTHDLAIPGYQTVLGAVEIPPGGREGRHTHPGAVVVYIQEGVLTFDYEGNPTMTYKAGDSFFGINKGTSPVKAVATFVVEKGKPLTSPAP
jgi:quercetin dioxygenase-like cupin family protein